MGTFLTGNEKTLGLNCRPQKCSNCATLEFCENAKFGESRPDSAQSAEIPQNPAKCKSAGQFCINPTLHPISSILRHSFRQGAGGTLAITRPEKSSRKKRIQTDHHRRINSFHEQSLHFHFLGWFLWRFGAISPNLASAAEESGFIPAEMECGLSWTEPEMWREDLKIKLSLL